MRSEMSKWTLKREVSLGDILAFLSAALAVIYAYTTLDKRVSMLESAIVLQKDIDRRQDEEQIRAQVRIEEALRTLAHKIDRPMEKPR